MSITKVAFEDFAKNPKSYYKSKVAFPEYPIFVNSNGMFTNYYIKVGKQGKLNLCYGQNKSFYLSGELVFSADRGLLNRQKVILPTLSYLGRLLPKTIKIYQDNLETYKKTYENAKAKLATIDKLKNDYPELIL